MANDGMVDTVREWLTAANPGFVTKQDLAMVESRLEELEELVGELEKRLKKSERERPDSFAGDDE
jgi:hypothetical protein